MQLRAIAGCVKLGYFFFPHFWLICLWLLSALSSADHSVSQSPWEVHTTLATPFGTWARMSGVHAKARGRIFPPITLTLFYSLPDTRKQSGLKLHCSALLQAHLTSVPNVQNWWLSFLVLHTVLVTNSRGHRTCSAKKPAGLQTADTWPERSPKCVPTDMIYRTKHIQIYLEEMAWNTRLLINGLSCERLNLFLVNGGLSSTDPKSLEIHGSPSSGAADTSRREATDYDKGAEALRELGHWGCEMNAPVLMVP